MPFRASPCAAAHDGNIEFVERNSRLAGGALVGWSPSEQVSIRLFNCRVFQFAPTPSAVKPQCTRLEAKPLTRQRDVLAITKMSIVIFADKHLIYMAKR